MNCVVFFSIIGIVMCILELTPKKILVEKVSNLVTGFLTESQISTSVDIIALDIHRVKQPEEIISDVYNYLSSSLSADQSKVIKDSYNNMVKDLGAEGANDALNRIKKIVIYAVSPAVEMVRVSSETPELAYIAISKQLTPDFIKSVIVLIRDTLTPTEWNSMKTNFGALLRITELWDRFCNVAPMSTVMAQNTTTESI